ncbi:MAG: hypothetical protein HZA52_17165 [Planctomycetes bacterium]|nr:hypothetical protein [Planctomycetota bacterium]
MLHALIALAFVLCTHPNAADHDFAALAETYKKAHGLEGKAQADVDFAQVLDQHYVHAELGVLDVRYPKSDMPEKVRVKELQDVSLALLDLQVRWLDWAGAGNPAEAALRKDLTTFRKAVAGAHPPAWSAEGAEIPGPLPLVLGLKQDMVELARKVGVAARSGDALGAAVARTEPIQIVFTPSRRQFVELGAFIGWFDESARGSFWVDGMPAWADMFWRDRQVLPLVYAPGKVSPDDLSAGYSMNDREKTGMVEYVAQRGMHSLLWFYYGDALDPAFESGAAIEVVVELYGQNNARTGTATRGKTTFARSVFIPGAPSQGGFLPKNSADSLWRATLGADHFVKVLREAQKAGARDGSKGDSKLAFFELTSDDTTKHFYVRAPFLGSASDGKEAPTSEFLQDYSEFFRAYKGCFLHWLSTEGAAKGGKKASEKLFAELLSALIAKPDGADFESVVQQIYGQPYSAKEESVASLEGRFLAWLGSQK